jgi:hypothetical protein
MAASVCRSSAAPSRELQVDTPRKSRRAVASGGTVARDRRFPMPDRARPSSMTISFVHLQPLVALLAGILILLVPRLLNYIVAIYLIIIGITGLLR